MLTMKSKYHYLTAALIWATPGLIITTKGLLAYSQILPSDKWLLAITLGVLVMFYMVFRKVVGKYSAHIDSLPESSPIWRTFPVKGWLLMLFMFGLGMTMKLIGAPVEFIASFYSGLGPMLFWAALRFLQRV